MERSKEQTNNEIVCESVEKSVLIQLLKEKSKDLKEIQKQIKGISSEKEKWLQKFNATFQANKRQQREVEELRKAIEGIIGPTCASFFQNGGYEADSILEMYNNQKLTEQDKLQPQSQVSLRKTFSESEGQQQSYNTNIYQMQLNQQKQLEEAEQLQQKDKELSELKQRIQQLSDVIVEKESQMGRFSLLEQDFTALKVKFTQQDKKIKRQEAEINALNQEVSLLKQQVVNYQQLKNLNDQAQDDTLKCLNETDNNSNMLLITEIPLNSPPQSNSINYRQNPTVQQSQHIVSEINIQVKNQDNFKSINFQYLKNILLKYFVYIENKEFKEASILMRAIANIMKMSHNEMQMIEEARASQAQQQSLWQQIFNGKFCARNQQESIFQNGGIHKNMHGKFNFDN